MVSSETREFPRPVVVLSQCLELEPVRYNGVVIPYKLVRALQRHVDLVPVCPEVGMGMGVPRDPIRVAEVDGVERLVQPSTGIDWTDPMVAFIDGFLGTLGEVDGFLLKTRSPSCGPKEVPVYRNAEPKAMKTGRSRGGFFAEAVLARYPGLAIEDEGRLNNFGIREHWLTRLFALAALRQVEASGQMKELVRYHAEHKLLLMATNQAKLRAMGPIVANHKKRPFVEVVAAYRAELEQALAKPGRRPSQINVLMHVLGYFSKQLNAREKAHFLDELERYRNGRTILGAVLTVVRSWIARFEQPYLASQVYLQPFPEELIQLADSGKGRDPF
jgi:uncharacterized protein YbgA (DUF1722 family)/uncharacterized protein YbbK (DUF523 family)